MSRSAVLWFVVCFAVLAHTWSVLDLWNRTDQRRHGADFASYYYAVQAAADGANPYDNTELVRLSKADGTRSSVYPYLYPPPFLLTMAWALPLDLFPAYLVWFWIDELFAVLVGLVLWRWWRDMGPALPVVLLAIFGSWSIFAHNHFMGQVNLLVLAVALAGVWAADRDRDVLGGVLVGAACLFKMSPALFVVWWLTHRKWRAVGSALATAVVLSVATLPLAGLEVQEAFYRDVLPTFGNGDYGGLTVKISLFANHSLPALYDRLFPGNHKILSSTAQALSTATALAIAGGLLWAFRPPSAGPGRHGGRPLQEAGGDAGSEAPLGDAAGPPSGGGSVAASGVGAVAASGVGTVAASGVGTGGGADAPPQTVGADPRVGPEAGDPFVVAGQVGAVCVALLLVPVYTYEHHLVWAVPALAVAATAVFTQRLPSWCALGVAYAWFVFALDIVDLQAIYGRYEHSAPLVATFVRECKLVGLLVVGAMCVWLGTGRGVRYAPRLQGDAMAGGATT